MLTIESKFFPDKRSIWRSRVLFMLRASIYCGFQRVDSFPHVIYIDRSHIGAARPTMLPSPGLILPSATALMMGPSVATASSAKFIGGKSRLPTRSRGKIRLSRNLSIGPSPALARSTALRSNSSASPSSKVGATTVVRFFDPRLRPGLHWQTAGRVELKVKSRWEGGEGVAWHTARQTTSSDNNLRSEFQHKQ
jgi:hypothetical protein